VLASDILLLYKERDRVGEREKGKEEGEKSGV